MTDDPTLYRREVGPEGTERYVPVAPDASCDQPVTDDPRIHETRELRDTLTPDEEHRR